MPELKEKLCSPSEAASLIKDGTRIYFGGFSVHLNPMAFIHELVRKGIKDLTLVEQCGATNVDILVGAGCVKKVEYAYVGLEEFGVAPNFRRAAENGEIELEEYSEVVAIQRFDCSSNGQSCFTTRDMLGTDIPKYNPRILDFTSPYNGQKYHLVPAADPDWVVIHAPLADKYGNVIYFPNPQTPQIDDLRASRGSKNLIVTVEQIVNREFVMAHPSLNVIPRHRTTAVVELPYGAHPTSCIQVYDQDREHLAYYAKVGRDPIEFKKYLDEYVYGCKTHMDYLKLIGVETLAKLRSVGGYL